MRHRKVIIGLLALVVCGVLAVVLWPEKEIPEPIYNGKKLSEWVLNANFSTWSGEGALALQTIGTNGIPSYLRWIRYEQGFLRRAQFKCAECGRRWFGLKWVPVDSEFNRANGAIQALTMLGER